LTDNSHCVALAHQVSERLNSAGVPTWLEYGSALGAVRDGGFAKSDNDIDLGVWWKDWDRMKEVVSGFEASCHFIYCDSGGQFCHVKNIINGSEIELPRVEIFGFHEDGVKSAPINYWGDDYWKPAFVSKAYYQKNLKKIKFEGLDFLVSKYAEKYLDHIYKDVGGEGMTWRTPVDRSEINNWETDLMSFSVSDKTTGYVEGVFDLFHIGHLRMLERSSEIFDKVVAGVHSDETVSQYKGTKPVIPYAHRVEIIRSCKFVDDVIEAPLFIDSIDGVDFLNENNLDYLVHGNTDYNFLEYHYPTIMEESRLFLMDETLDYHTQDLIKKCQIK
jgi:cytidyltransferase-like protein